jgi:hypothetical protein
MWGCLVPIVSLGRWAKLAGLRTFACVSGMLGPLARAWTILVSAAAGLAVVSASAFFNLIVESNFAADEGASEIDKVIRRFAYEGQENLQRELRDGLERINSSRGTEAFNGALSDAGAACSAQSTRFVQCKIERFAVMRSVDLINPRYVKSNWVILINFNQQNKKISGITVKVTATASEIRWGVQ